VIETGRHFEHSGSRATFHSVSHEDTKRCLLCAGSVGVLFSNALFLMSGEESVNFRGVTTDDVISGWWSRGCERRLCLGMANEVAALENRMNQTKRLEAETQRAKEIKHTDFHPAHDNSPTPNTSSCCRHRAYGQLPPHLVPNNAFS